MDELLPKAVAVLSRQLDLDELVAQKREITLEDVRRYLTAHVTRLLDRNPALLMSILYRIDVAESAVKRAFAEAGPAELPERLADLMIERQLEKIRLRRSFEE